MFLRNQRTITFRLRLAEAVAPECYRVRPIATVADHCPKPARTRRAFEWLALTMFGAQAAACGSQASSDVLRQYGNRIVATSDLDKQVRDDLHSSGEDGDVGIVRADFDGNGVKDFAVLTKEAGLESKLTVRLVMCKKACRESQVFDVGVFSGFQYLTKVKAGATIAPAEAAGESKEHARQITNPAVRFNEYAKTHTTYYWDASTNSFRELATGD